MQPPYLPTDLQARLTACAPLDLELSFRPMFGGIMGYAHGRPFASLSDIGLAFKLAGAHQAALLALPGAAPLRYAPDAPPSRSYVVVPHAMLDDAKALGAWAERSAAQVAAQPPKAKARRSP